MLNYYYYLFIYFQILVKFFFSGFLFLLESRTNNGAKFNFIGIKKLRVSPFFFLLYIIFFPGHGGLGTTLP